MMDWTDRHDRYFLRLIAPHFLLYTEMINALAIYHGDRQTLLRFDPQESPVALQIGGADPFKLAEAAAWSESSGYDEINLNVGCPSPRVSAGSFGACLMKEPALVAECVAAMQAKVKVPVTVKCRIGVDDIDSYEALHRFIQTIAETGVQTFIVHARKAWLKGLSPKQNREIPPLCYDVVHQVKSDFPHLNIIINGGIKTVADVQTQLSQVDGVMIGRAAYQTPYFLADIEKVLFPHSQVRTPKEVLQDFLPYVATQLKEGVKLSHMTRHILGLFHGMPGANAWRRFLSERAPVYGAGIDVLQQAFTFID